MGSSHSIRATHFQRPHKEPRVDPVPSGEYDEHHISISNKMVERLVEDATLAGGAAPPVVPPPSSKSDYRDQFYIDKLKSLDENHSSRYGITMEGVNAIAARIDMRTSNMFSSDPICADYKERVISCYNSNGSTTDIIKCWDTVGEFTKCVSDAASARLRARTQKEAREHARRSRHVAHAREHALRDLASTSLLD